MTTPNTTVGRMITASTTRSLARAEPVGSLVRSREITDAIERLYGDESGFTRSLVLVEKAPLLRDLADAAAAAIPGLVQRQLDAGLDVVTDGEVRRTIFISSFYDAVEGLDRPKRDETGSLDPLRVQGMRKVASPVSEEIAFLRGLGDFPFKVTFPAPSYFYMSDWVPLHEDSAYTDRQAFVDDVVTIEQQLIAEAVAAGARWIQIDFPLYPALVDRDYVAKLDFAGTPEELFDAALAADAKVVEHVPDDVRLGLHLCRGNVPGGFWSGSLEPVAERMFNELPYERFVVEWEDVEREGDYSPLKHVPKDRIVALGLVSTKNPEVEREDDIVSRLEDASRHLAIDQLALSPQCGFASIYGDRLVEKEESQWRKLEVIGRVADRVWGR